MALSNIFREPRREITESIVGIAVVGGLAGLDYRFANWFNDYTGVRQGQGIVFGLVLGLAVAFFSVMLLLGSHAIGEGICNFLARRGLELRPKMRYRDGWHDHD